jgi:hypothetical protein
MSYSHIKLKKIYEDTKLVKYQIASMDFNTDHVWQKFGVIEIDKISGTYTHKDNELWEWNKIYPIDFEEVPIEKRRELAKGKYKDYGSGRWTMNVFNFIKNSLETNYFPEEKDLIS